MLASDRKDGIRSQLWRGVFLLFCIIPMPLLAQLPTGTILGAVKDTTGAVVPGVTVSLRNVETDLTRTAITGSGGEYRIPGLPVGHYDVRAERTGFKTETQAGLTLEVQQEEVVNFELQIGTTQQEVVVTGAVPIVNTTNSSLGGLVNETKMEDLPLNGRNYVDLTLLQAGVTQNKEQGSAGGISGTWFSSNGAPERSNNFLLDGAQMVNVFGGASSSQAGTTLGVDGIREYKVITTAFSAEYGMVMGSQMVIVTKGGTNQFHGDAFEYLRNSDLDARNFFDYDYLSGGPRLPHFERNNFGGSFGGPIKKDKTFFYAVYEGLRQTLGITTAATVMPAACHTANNVVTSACIPTLGAKTLAVAPVIQPLLALYPSPNLGSVYSAPTSAPVSVNYGQMRVDQNFSASDTFFARYTIDQSSQNAPTANGSAGGASSAIAAFPGFRALAIGKNQYATLAENHIVSSTLLNTARFSFTRTYLDANNDLSQLSTNLVQPQYSFLAGLPMGSISVPGLTALGSLSSESKGVRDLFTLSDDVFYTKGSHALKFGILANRFTDAVKSTSGLLGTLSFSSLQNFLSGIPSNYTSLTPGSDTYRKYLYYTLGFYAQDDWRVNSRLTLNLGLRWEFNTPLSELNGHAYNFQNYQTDATTTPGLVTTDPSYKNLSPRVGFAWDVTGKGNMSVRGAFGIYYDIANYSSALQQAGTATPPISSSSVHTNSTNQVVTLPFTYTAAEVGTSLNTIAYHIQRPHALQYNLTVERKLPGNVGLSVSYVGLRGFNLWTALEGNPEIPTSAVNGAEFYAGGNPRINPNWSSISVLTTASSSWYNSLQVVATKRVSRGLEFQGTYTWGQSLDTTQGQLRNNDCQTRGGPISTDPYNLNTDKGPSCWDVTNNLHFNVLYHFPNIKSNNIAASLLHGWWMGSIVTIQSGMPFSLQLGTQRSRSGDVNSLSTQEDRPNVGTTTTTTTIGGKSITFIPFNPSTVITGNPQQWFNPLMFDLQAPGFLGDSSRDMLRGPGVGEWDFSLNKDTALPFLGEQGNLELRAEFFNITNRPIFALPNNMVFSGALTDTGTYSEAPLSTAGQITTTIANSRQIQLALKLIF